MDGWAGGCTDGEANGWMDVVGGQTDEWACGWIRAQVDKWVAGWVGVCTDRQVVNKWTEVDRHDRWAETDE